MLDVLLDEHPVASDLHVRTLHIRSQIRSLNQGYYSAIAHLRTTFRRQWSHVSNRLGRAGQ